MKPNYVAVEVRRAGAVHIVFSGRSKSESCGLEQFDPWNDRGLWYGVNVSAPCFHWSPAAPLCKSTWTRSARCHTHKHTEPGEISMGVSFYPPKKVVSSEHVLSCFRLAQFIDKQCRKKKKIIALFFTCERCFPTEALFPCCLGSKVSQNTSLGGKWLM